MSGMTISDRPVEAVMIEVIPNWHPLLVHFPIALISVSAFFHLAAILLRNQPRCATHCAVLAHSTLWLGAGGRPHKVRRSNHE